MAKKKKKTVMKTSPLRFPQLKRSHIAYAWQCGLKGYYISPEMD